MKSILPRCWQGMVIFVWSLPAGGQTTSYFRSDNGVALDKTSLPERLDDAKALVWKTPIAAGHSTPCVTDKLVIVTTFDGQRLATVALDRKDGKVRWQRPAPAPKIEPYHKVSSPAVATPAWDGERIFVFFGSYGLLCYDDAGELLWQQPFGPFQDEFGASSSPILADGLVILTEDHDKDSYIIALDAKTGKTVWKTERPEATRSYATPTIWRTPTQTLVLAPGALRLTAYDLKSGKEAWWCDGLARIMIPTIVKGDGVIYVASWSPGGDSEARIGMEPWNYALKEWDKNGDKMLSLDELPAGEVAQRFYRIDLDQNEKIDQEEWKKHARIFELAKNSVMALRPSGQGDVTKTNVTWTYDRGIPYTASPVAVDGLLYMVKNGGVLTVLDAQDGQLVKQSRLGSTKDYHASPVAGAGLIYFASVDGVVTVLQAGREPKILSKNDLTDPIYGSPVIANGQVFIRTNKHLYCFAKRAGDL